jgi:hypothetical protein
MMCVVVLDAEPVGVGSDREVKRTDVRRSLDGHDGRALARVAVLDEVVSGGAGLLGGDADGRAVAGRAATVQWMFLRGERGEVGTGDRP